ncbi:MAG: HlyD family efflux transporter periplasmic adaptor subunit [Pseudomonadota bacterium]
MEVTIDDEGKTNIRHVYTVSAPVAGRVLRISHPSGTQGFSIHIGDAVTANETVVAVMRPAFPTFIDVRSREELQAAVAAADAAITLSQAEVRRIEAALEFSNSNLRRAETLVKTGAVSVRAFDQAKLDVATNEAALSSAKAQLEVRRSERTSIAAKLIDPSEAISPSTATCCIQIKAPESGRVLKIRQDSEAVVLPGTPLVDIGDSKDLEVITDLLSTDAVRIRPNAAVQIDGWGGRPIEGRVVRVDPAGFLKVSALGVEEQRVRTTIDLVGPPDAWEALGHEFRVIVHVTIWKAESALRVPVGALFRKGDDWAVFAMKDGTARATVVKIGQRNNRIAEVQAGLSEGDRVILHPSDRIRDGTAVAERENH